MSTLLRPMAIVALTITTIPLFASSGVSQLSIVGETQTEQLATDTTFHSNDLSAFMLHGHVKEMTEIYGSAWFYKMKFNEQGQLTDFIILDCYSYDLSHKGKQLILTQPKDEEQAFLPDRLIYEINAQGRLSKLYDEGGDQTTKTLYYAYNANGWPTKRKDIDGKEGYDDIVGSAETVTYSNIDSHGNWLISETDGSQVKREITYYTVDQISQQTKEDNSQNKVYDFINKYFYETYNNNSWALVKSIMTPTFYKKYYHIMTTTDGDWLHSLGSVNALDEDYTHVESIEDIGNNWYKIRFHAICEEEEDPDERYYIGEAKWKVILVNGSPKIADLDD